MKGALRRASRDERIPTKAIQVIVGFTIIFFFLIRNILVVKSINSQGGNESENDIQVFELKKDKTLPAHLGEIDPNTDLDSVGFEGIDAVHRNGLIHAGAWIQVLDSPLSTSPNTLLLRRGEKLVTCPESWSLVGEHAYRDESPLETMRRGIKEELGSRFLQYVDKHGSIREITDSPVYYERHYGESNGNRVDRQVTYLWLVEMNSEKNNDPIERIQKPNDLLELDHEVGDHLWKPLDELRNWVESDTLHEDFCHETISSLLLFGQEKIKELK